jgi:hypothetical protein
MSCILHGAFSNMDRWHALSQSGMQRPGLNSLDMLQPA